MGAIGGGEEEEGRNFSFRARRLFIKGVKEREEERMRDSVGVGEESLFVKIVSSFSFPFFGR